MKNKFTLLAILIFSPYSSGHSERANQMPLLDIYFSGVYHLGSAAVLIDGFKRYDVDVVTEDPDEILDFLADEFNFNEIKVGTRAAGKSIHLTGLNGSSTRIGAFEVFFDDVRTKNSFSENLALLGRDHFRTLKTGYLFEVYEGQSSILIVFQVSTMEGLWPDNAE